LVPQHIAQVISRQVVNKLAIELAANKLVITQAVNKPVAKTLVIVLAISKPVINILAARRLAIDTELALVQRIQALTLII
jgi:hypothetical protein